MRYIYHILIKHPESRFTPKCLREEDNAGCAPNTPSGNTMSSPGGKSRGSIGVSALILGPMVDERTVQVTRG